MIQTMQRKKTKRQPLFSFRIGRSHFYVEDATNSDINHMETEAPNRTIAISESLKTPAVEFYVRQKLRSPFFCFVVNGRALHSEFIM